ncbi:MAG: hypothetical protein K6U75_14945 [Firmicutes bacterium]|nr:hypothetical protein [Bacillota bacterium]
MRPEKTILLVFDTLAMVVAAYLLPSVNAAFGVGLVGGAVLELWRCRNQPITIPTLKPLNQGHKWLLTGFLLTLWVIVQGLLFWMALTLTTYGREFSLRLVGVTAGYSLSRVAVFAARWMRQSGDM